MSQQKKAKTTGSAATEKEPIKSATYNICVVNLHAGNDENHAYGKAAEAHGANATERLASALQTNSDFYLVSAEHTVKAAAVAEVSKWQNLKPNAFYVPVHDLKTDYLGEWLLGFGRGEMHAPYVLLGKNAFEKFVAENVIPTNNFELQYIAEKTCALHEIQKAETREKGNPLGLVAAFKMRLATLLKYYRSGGIPAIHKFIFIALSILLFGLMVQRSRTASISGDEFTQHNFSKVIVDYFRGTDDSSAMGLVRPGKDYGMKPEQVADMKNYGCGFDTFCAFTASWFNVEDIMLWRHFWNAFFGFMAMFFGALIVRRVTGGSWKYAWLALLVLVFTPRFFGDSLNNPKDVPFATGYVLSFYYMIKTFANLRRIRIAPMLGLILTLGLGISIRIGGLLSIGIMCAYAGMAFLNQYGLNIFKNLNAAFKLVTVLFILGFLGFFAGLIPWPYGMQDPFTNPFASLKSFGSYGVNIRQLFDGVMYDSQMLPKFYLLKYLWITMPVGIILGFILGVVGVFFKKLKVDFGIWMCLFAAIFPIAYIYLTGGKVYGGLRHILFTVPMFGVCAVLGYYLIAESFKKIKWMQIVMPTLAGLFTILPASFVLKNHPFEYIYFNELVGGTQGAYGKYEMDYYLASLKPSTEYFLENVARKNPNKTFYLGTYDLYITKYYCRKDTNVKVGFTRFEQRNSTPYMWDYAVFYNGYNDNYKLTKGLYPPPGTVYSPMLDGKPMGVLIKRLSYEDAYAKKAENKKQFDSAIMHYKNYLAADPKNYEVLLNLSNAYLYKNNFDSADIFGKKCLEVYPEYQSGLTLMSQICKYKGRFDSGINYLKTYLKFRPVDGENYANLAELCIFKYKANKDVNSLSEGLKYVKDGIKNAPAAANLYRMGAQITSELKDQNLFNKFASAYNAFAKQQGMTSEALDAMTELYNEFADKSLTADQFGAEFLGIAE